MAIVLNVPIVLVVLMAHKLPIVLMVTGFPDSPDVTERREREESECVAT